jgi:drug/metabolite transporter (DMT)-like permease
MSHQEHAVPVDNEADDASLKSWFFRPYFQVFISIVLSGAAQLFLKIGVDTQLGATWYSLVLSCWFWIGVLAILGSLFSWLCALKTVPLVIAFNLAATNHILVAIGSWVFLGESISLQRWLGISLVALGAVFVAGPLARMKEKP